MARVERVAGFRVFLLFLFLGYATAFAKLIGMIPETGEVSIPGWGLERYALAGLPVVGMVALVGVWRFRWWGVVGTGVVYLMTAIVDVLMRQWLHLGVATISVFLLGLLLISIRPSPMTRC